MSAAGLVALGVFTGTLALVGGVIGVVAPRAPAGAAERPRTLIRPDEAAPRVALTLGALSAPDDEGERAEQRLLLLQAGFRGEAAWVTWLALRTALTVALPALLWVAWRPERWSVVIVALVLAAGAGNHAPLWLARIRRARRQQRIGRAVANMLDMLVSCMEAGLGLDLALRHVARQVRMASPELATELELVNAEMSAGIPRSRAFAQLDQRTGVEELAALVQVLGAAERYGSGISQSLRAHAQLSRRRRALQAEQRAARASPKLTVVMILFVLPPLFVVLLGATFLRISAWILHGEV